MLLLNNYYKKYNKKYTLSLEIPLVMSWLTRLWYLINHNTGFFIWIHHNIVLIYRHWKVFVKCFGRLENRFCVQRIYRISHICFDRHSKWFDTMSFQWTVWLINFLVEDMVNKQKIQQSIRVKCELYVTKWRNKSNNMVLLDWSFNM